VKEIEVADGLWAIRNIGGPVTSKQTLAKVGSRGAWLVVRYIKVTLVEVFAASRVFVEPVLFSNAEVCVRVNRA